MKNHASRYSSYDEFLSTLVRACDVHRSGSCSYGEFATALNNLGFDLNYQEIHTLVRAFEFNN